MAADCPARELHGPDEHGEHHAAEGEDDKQRVERAFPAQDIGQEINLHGPLLLENLLRQLLQNPLRSRLLSRMAPFLRVADTRPRARRRLWPHQNVGLGLRRTTWKCMTLLLWRLSEYRISAPSMP